MTHPEYTKSKTDDRLKLISKLKESKSKER